MIRFDYARPTDVTGALREGAGEHAASLAGGTNLVDLQENIARPSRVVDINRLDLKQITETEGGRPAPGRRRHQQRDLSLIHI